jgi:HPt (histidine-containing phosphotransfer) domain-containing protein
MDRLGLAIVASAASGNSGPRFEQSDAAVVMIGIAPVEIATEGNRHGGDDLAEYRDPAGGTSDLLRELVQVFRDDTPAYLDALQDANTRGDAEDVDRVVHTLKGSSSAIGARQMAAICVELERTSTSNAPRTLALVQELHKAFASALEILERMTAV